MNYIIREILKEEYSLLENFLYEAIFVSEGISPPPKAIIKEPELQVYIKDFGMKKDDMGLVAEIDKKIVGAVWVRIMNDYGHINNLTPSLAISLYKEYRGLGIGTELMRKMLNMLKQRGYKQTSLSVQKANYAIKMYKKIGFEIVNENEEEYLVLDKVNYENIEYYYIAKLNESRTDIENNYKLVTIIESSGNKVISEVTGTSSLKKILPLFENHL